MIKNILHKTVKLIALFGFLILASCGGGGGGGGGGSASNSTITVSFNPSTVVYSFPSGRQGLNQPGVTFTVTASNPPSTSVYATMSATGNVLASGPFTFYSNGVGSYTGTVRFNQDLPVQTYTGNLNLQLYQDSAHTLPYNVIGGTVPYKLIVYPGISLTATINGAPASLSALNVTSGSVVHLESSIPVQWAILTSGGSAWNVTSTQTSWTGTIQYGLSTSGGVGELDVQASTVSVPNIEAAQTTARIFVTQ